jgi:1-acyl-sn-glycerol-3-phosphate acyltransferase
MSPSDQRTYEPALKLRSWVWYTIYAISRTLLAIRFRIRVTGGENTPRGPVLLACKHVSAWDIPVGAFLGSRFFDRKAYFQMGSFIGYPVFGRIVPAMQACGGFSVLRPKEVLRLRKSESRERLHELMDEVNGVAEATRRAVLEQGGVLVVFPEGTRDATTVRPVRSTHEIESALDVAARSAPEMRPVIVPATLNYGRKRFFRRALDVQLGVPIPLEGATAAGLASRIEDALRATWRPASGAQAIRPA